MSFWFNGFIYQCIVLIVGLVMVFPCLAAKVSRPLSFKEDLSKESIKYSVKCPLPKNGPCVIKKPVGTGYRVLTNDVSLEDVGESWVADFTKVKRPRGAKRFLHVLGANGELHEIVVTFPMDLSTKDKKEKNDAKENEQVKETEQDKPAQEKTTQDKLKTL